MFLAHDSLRRPLLVAMLAAGGIGIAVAAPADQNFDSEPLVILGNPGTLNGIIYFNNDAIKSVSIVNDGWIAAGADHALGFRSSDMGTSTQVGFKTADGSEFKLNSFVLDRGLGGDSLVTVKGYRDNAEVAITTADVSSDFATVNVAANTAWENIDEVRITGLDLDIDIDDLDFSPAVVGNTAPVITGLNGNTVAWPGFGNTVTLDSGGDATVSDAELGALNGGNGDWADATISVQRVGTATAWDSFGFSLSGALSAGGGQLFRNGITIGNYSQNAGVMTVTFTDISGPIPTSDVTQIVRGLTYSNNQPSGDTAIRITVNDGSLFTASDVTVQSDTIYITTIADTATINPTDGVSFSEAIAIAAEDVTGGQTLVFGSGFGNAMVTVTGATAISESLTVDLGSNANLTLAGNGLSLASGTTLTLRNSAGGNTSFANALGGAGAVTKIGAGRVRLAAASGYSGATAVNAGELCVTGSLNGTSSLTVASGATLSGTGSIFSAGSTSTVAVGSGATLSPGLDGIGALGIRGNLSMSSGSTLRAEINGATAGSGYGQVLVNGAVTLNSAILTVNHDYTPGNGDTYTLLVNDAADAITGTFSGLAEGSTMTAGGNGTVLTASYIGATGNDFTLTAPIAPVNEPPVAVDDSYTTNEDQSIVIILSQLLANDTDADGDTLNIIAVTNPVNGSVSNNGPTITFYPVANFHGTASFNYTVSDGILTDSATVFITVNPVDDPTVATADTRSLAEDSSTNGNVLTNDTDPDDVLTVASYVINGVTHNAGTTTTIRGVGAIQINANGNYSFVPLPNYYGAVPIITYTTTTGVSSTLTITVTPTNDAPVAVDDFFTTQPDQPIMISLADLLAGDIDIDGDQLSPSYLSNPTNGAINYSGGLITFTPNPGFSGFAYFDYGITDGIANDVGRVHIWVGPNESPVAANDGPFLAEIDEPLSLPFSTLLANDTDPDSDVLTVYQAGNAVNGQVALVGGNVVFTPSWDYTGPASFTYRASDGKGGFSTATVQVLVGNQPPVVANAIPNQNATEDSAFSFQFAANTFSDPDVGTTLSYTAQVAGGGSLPAWLSFNALTRTFSGTPLDADVGTISIDVIASDGLGGTVTDTFNIVVANVNDAPSLVSANGISYYTENDTGVVLNPDLVITDPDSPTFSGATVTISDFVAGDVLSVVNSGGFTGSYNAATGVLTLTGPGSLADLQSALRTVSFYSTSDNPTLGGTDNARNMIVFQVTDGEGAASAKTTTFIVITAVNDAPVVANSIPNQTATGGAAFSLQFAANTFFDVDEDTLSYSAGLAGGGSLPSWLSFNAATRTFSGTPSNSNAGTISITVTADDENGGTVTDTFDLVVANSAPVVTNVGTLTADGTYKTGDTIVVVVTFDQEVTYTGTPQLTLETGTTDRVLNLVNTLPINSIYFNYLVQAGDTSADLDYISTSALALNGGTIRNSENTNAVLTLPTPGAAGSLAANAAIRIDTAGPTADIVVSDANIIIGDTPTVTITFSEPVTDFVSTDLTAAGGTLSNLTTTNNITWTADFAPTADTEISGTVALAAGAVEDAVGNTNGSESSFIYSVDTRRPTATLVVADTALKAAETTTVMITFSEPVTGLELEGLTAQNATLSDLVPSGGNVWIATLTADDSIDDDTNVVTLDYTDIADLKGNDGLGTKDSNNYAIDTLRPTATIVVVDAALKAGETSGVTITFNEEVTGFTSDDIEVENGALGVISTSDNIVYTATLTPTANIEDATNMITVDNTGVVDGKGNEGSGISESNNYEIDTAVPVITSVVFTPGNYVVGNQIPVTVTFSEAVEVLNPDTPTTAVYGLTLIPDHGDDFAAATYLTPTGNTMALIATVPAGVADADGITPGTELVGGPALADAAGNLLVLTLNNISGASGVLVDSIAPVVSTPIPDQPLVIGDAPVTIDLTQHFTDIGISPMVFVVLNNSDGTKASASITGNTLTLTGLANGVTDITIRADDNYGGFVVDTFQAAVGTPEPTAVQPVLSGALNLQTGLFELTVSVTNTTPQPLNGLRLHVDFSAYLAQHPSLRLYNATATTAPGIAHVDHAFPMAVNDAISVKLSFYTSTRLFPDPFEPVLTVETLPSSALPDTNGNGVQPTMVNLPDGNKLIEFPAEAGKWYRVRYSHDMVNWYDSPVPLQAGANRVQWIDSGPPFTQSPPSSVTSRFYIVNEITAP